MIVLGLLLMLACAALAVDAVVQNTGMMHAVAFNQSISHLSLGAVFVAGAVVGLLFALGMAMFAGGFGRAARARREQRAAIRESAAETEALRAHNERLERELASTRGTDADPYPADGTTTTTTTGGRHRVSR
jgi:uncharacterized integral membrane protein